MALVDPRLLESLRPPPPPPPPPPNTLDRVLRGLDGEMSSVLDRTDLDEGDKVKLYNQILLRYNTMANKRVKQPTRVVVVNDDGAAAAAAATRVVIWRLFQYTIKKEQFRSERERRDWL